MTTTNAILLGFAVGIAIYHYFILRHFRRVEFFRGFLHGMALDEELSVEELAAAIETAYQEDNEEFNKITTSTYESFRNELDRTIQKIKIKTRG